MDNRGFSLIELLIVIVIIGILGLALGTSFQGSIASGRTEAEIKELYADLMNARAQAMQSDRTYFASLAANTYQLIEDTDQDGIMDAAPEDTPLFSTAKLFQYGLTAGTGTITFNSRGIVTALGTIQFDITNAGAVDYDCIELTQTRIKMGRMNGGTCVVK